MANTAARIFCRNGKSLSQTLRSRLVVQPRPLSNVIRDQLLAQQPLINQAQGMYLQRPVLGFDFVESRAREAAAQGKMRLAINLDDDNMVPTDDDDDESQFLYVDSESCSSDDDDSEDDDDDTDS